MVICPECGYPYSDDTYVLGARDVICTNCRWMGSSTALIQTSGDLEGGVQAMQKLYNHLGTTISPRIASVAVQLGFLSSDKTVDNYKRIAKVLSRVTRATFKELVQAVIDDAEEHSEKKVTNESELH